MLHYTVNQRLHWACRQYGHSGGALRWLGVKRCQLCLQDTSCSAKRHRQAAVGHWVSLCVKCCRMVDIDHSLIADYDNTAFGAGTLRYTLLESRSMTGKFIYKNGAKPNFSQLLTFKNGLHNNFLILVLKQNCPRDPGGPLTLLNLLILFRTSICELELADLG